MQGAVRRYSPDAVDPLDAPAQDGDVDAVGAVVLPHRQRTVVADHDADRAAREATDEEIRHLTPCQHRGCRIARGEIEVDDLPKRLVEPQGDSVRTVSGGQFESNRRKF